MEHRIGDVFDVGWGEAVAIWWPVGPGVEPAPGWVVLHSDGTVRRQHGVFAAPKHYLDNIFNQQRGAPVAVRIKIGDDDESKRRARERQEEEQKRAERENASEGKDEVGGGE